MEKAERSERTFRVLLSQVLARNLPKKDLFSKCDSYVIFQWPGNPPMRTPTIPKDYDPQWRGWKAKFDYSVVLPNKSDDIHSILQQKKLRIECFAEHSYREDSLIGRVSIDLLSILAGPANQVHTLVSVRGVESGTIEFSASVECIGEFRCDFRRMSAHLPPRKENLFMTAQIGSEVTDPSDIVFHSASPFWSSVPSLTFVNSIQFLLDSVITVEVFAVEEETVGRRATCKIPIINYLDVKETWIHFREPLVFNDEPNKEKHIGIIEGEICMHDIPLPCQMRFGCNQNGEILDSALVLHGFYDFSDRNTNTRLQDTLNPGYDPSKLMVSPYTIPVSSIFEIEISQQLEQLEIPDSDYDSVLCYLATSLKDDNMAKQTFLHCCGVNSIIKFMIKQSKKGEIDAENEFSSFYLQAAAVLCNALENFSGNIAQASNEENILNLDSLFFLPGATEEYHFQIIQIFTYIAELSTIGRNRILQTNFCTGGVLKTFLYSAPEFILQTYCALTYHLIYEREDTKILIINGTDPENTVKEIFKFLNNSSRNIRMNTLRVIQQVSELSDTLLDQIMQYTLPEIHNATAEMFPKLLDMLVNCMHQGGSNGPIQPTIEHIQGLIELLHSDRSQGNREKVIKLLHFLLYQQKHSNDALRDTIFSNIKLSDHHDVQDLLFAFETFQWLGVSLHNKSVGGGSLQLLLPNLHEFLRLLSHENPLVYSQAKSTLVLLCKENLNSECFDSVLHNLMSFVRSEDCSVKALIVVISLWNELLQAGSGITNFSIWSEISLLMLDMVNDNCNSIQSDMNQVIAMSWECIRRVTKSWEASKILIASRSLCFDDTPTYNDFELLLIIVRHHPQVKEVLDLIYNLLQDKIQKFIATPSWNEFIHRSCLQIIDTLPQTKNSFTELCNVLLVYLTSKNAKLEEFALEVLERLTFSWSIDRSTLGISPEITKMIIEFLLKHLLTNEGSSGRCRELLIELMKEFPDIQHSGIVYLADWFITSSSTETKASNEILEIILQMPLATLSHPGFMLFMRRILLCQISSYNPELHETIIHVFEFFLQNLEIWEEMLLVATEIIPIVTEQNARLVIDIFEHLHKAILNFCSSYAAEQEEVFRSSHFLEVIGFGDLLELMQHPAMLPYFDQLVFLVTMTLNPPGSRNGENSVKIADNFATKHHVTLFVSLLHDIHSLEGSTETTNVLRVFNLFLSAIVRTTPEQLNLMCSHTNENFIDLFCDAIHGLLSSQEPSIRIIGNSLFALSHILRLNQNNIIYFGKTEKRISICELVVFMGSREDIIYFMNFCKFLRVIFFNQKIQQEFTYAHGFNEMSRAIYRTLGYLRSSRDAAQAILEAVNFLVGAAQVKSLQRDIVRQCVLPVIIKLLQSEANAKVLVPALGFIYFMSKDNTARIELIDSPDIDCLSNLITKSSLTQQVATAAKECFLSLGGVNVLCTITESGLQQYQENVSCKTCGISSICRHCATICHYDHILTPPQSSQVVCRCGSSDYCLIKKRPSLRLIYPLRLCSLVFTGRNHEFQSWYFCRTCFRDMGKGICVTCSQVCHAGHDIRFGNDSRFFCDCNERYGMSCLCLRPRDPVVPGKLPRERVDGFVDPLSENTSIELIEQKPDEKVERRVNYSEDDTCTVCMDQKKEALFFPCGHIVSCMECACMLKQRGDPCIICREKIDDVVRTYKV